MRTKIDIYTDGRHAKGTLHDVSYGACMIPPEGPILNHSGIVDVPAFFEMFGAYVSNPTAELYAAAKMLEIFRHGKGLDITIFSDYNGVQKWISKEWRAKKNYIQFLLEHIDHYKEELKKNGSTVKFEWIKGHAGNKYNELADSLCKVKPHDEFVNWVDKHNIAFKKKEKSLETV